VNYFLNDSQRKVLDLIVAAAPPGGPPVSARDGRHKTDTPPAERPIRPPTMRPRGFYTALGTLLWLGLVERCSARGVDDGWGAVRATPAGVAAAVTGRVETTYDVYAAPAWERREGRRG